MTDRSNAIARRSPVPLPSLFGSGSLTDHLFGSTLFPRTLDLDMENLFSNSLPQYRQVDQGYEYEFNLAGFSEEDISIQIDPKANKLQVSAKAGDSDNARVASYSMTLMNEGKVEAGNVSTRYTNGLLTVTVKDDASSAGTFTIPLSSNKAVDEGDGAVTT